MLVTLERSVFFQRTSNTEDTVNQSALFTSEHSYALHLRHDAIVCSHHQDDDVGDLRAASAHGRERSVPGRVQECCSALHACPGSVNSNTDHMCTVTHLVWHNFFFGVSLTADICFLLSQPVRDWPNNFMLTNCLADATCGSR